MPSPNSRVPAPPIGGVSWHLGDRLTCCRRPATRRERLIRNVTSSLDMPTKRGYGRLPTEGNHGMKISVFGLGYVGCVSAACLAHRGHEVVGVDVNPAKIELIGRGQAPVVEERIGELTADVVRSGALRATTDVETAIGSTEVSLVCVGTPSAPNGSLSTDYLERVAAQIGRALAEHSHRHTVVFRSTMLPGTCLGLLVPIIERESGKTAGADFGVAVNPEFLREGTSV